VQTAEKIAKVYINAVAENDGSFTIWPESVTSYSIPHESTIEYGQLTFMARCLRAWSVTGDCNTDEVEDFEFFFQRYYGLCSGEKTGHFYIKIERARPLPRYIVDRIRSQDLHR
jgi:hypothetical protein